MLGMKEDKYGKVDSLIGAEAEIKGDIKAKIVILGGKIIGNIFAEEKVEVIDGGQVMGDIKSPAVVIAEGGIFEGHCEMMSSSKGKILEIPEKRSKGSQG